MRSHEFLASLWNHSPDTDTPRATSRVTPRLNWSTYGRVRFGSGLASEITPKLVGIDAKLISQLASVAKLQRFDPWAISSPFLSVHGAVLFPDTLMTVPAAGSYSDASVVVAATPKRL